MVQIEEAEVDEGGTLSHEYTDGCHTQWGKGGVAGGPWQNNRLQELQLVHYESGYGG